VVRQDDAESASLEHEAGGEHLDSTQDGEKIGSTEDVIEGNVHPKIVFEDNASERTRSTIRKEKEEV
jgi:hypothetical protein